MPDFTKIITNANTKIISNLPFAFQSKSFKIIKWTCILASVKTDIIFILATAGKYVRRNSVVDRMMFSKVNDEVVMSKAPYNTDAPYGQMTQWQAIVL
jgi:hypothetical protein